MSAEASNLDPEMAPELLARFFHGLSDPTRVRIALLLLEDELSVGELVARLKAPQGRVSSHLMCLRWCGFVTSRREGKRVYYRVTDRRVASLLGLGGRLLADNAAAVASCAILGAAKLEGDPL